MSAPTVHFTSDLHLGHEKVAGYRGFSSAAAHDEAVAERWRATVAPGDKVFVLGDVTGSGSRRVLIPALLALADLPGEKHLIAGNHDAVHPMARPRPSVFADYALAFESVQGNGRFKGFGIDVLLSHFPYTRDRGEETRYPQWRLPNLGEWLLHGHTHGTEKVSRYRHPWAGVREIHVGLDAWELTPVPVATIAALIEEDA